MGRHGNGTANQLVNKMDVITVETKAFKELMAKINGIANYVFSRQDDCKENEDDIWVDSCLLYTSRCV